MTEEEALKFLRHPTAALVDFALSLVNLTWQEELALNLCGRRHMTQERAAESAGYSVDAVQRWYRAGIKKLVVAWGGHDWIKKLVDSA